MPKTKIMFKILFVTIFFFKVLSWQYGQHFDLYDFCSSNLFSARKLTSRCYFPTYFHGYSQHNIWCFCDLNDFNFCPKVRVVGDWYIPCSEKALRSKGLLITLIFEKRLLGLGTTWFTVCPRDHVSPNTNLWWQLQVHTYPATTEVKAEWWSLHV